MADLKAPFPWYGGKGRWVNEILEMFGDIKVYSEPFAGSLAVLLGAPPREREIICDTDGMVCNAWRAIRHDPEAVAFWADYPTIHQDLTARRYWLIDWRDANAERLSLEMEFYCPKAAGVWIWCLSNWIGASGDMLQAHIAKVPRVHDRGGAPGTQVNRSEIPFWDKRPKVYDSMGGTGVQVQVLNKNLRPYTEDSGGRGVQAQRVNLAGAIGDGSRLSGWMFALADRLSRVVVLNRDWTSAVTPIMLQQAPTSPKPPVGIFLDPPYLLDNRRQSGLYANDREENNPARAAYEWAIEHGEAYRIAYACLEDDFPIPPGWTARYRTFGGIRAEERRRNLDCVMFSPACEAAQQSDQPRLF